MIVARVTINKLLSRLKWVDGELAGKQYLMGDFSGLTVRHFCITLIHQANQRTAHHDHIDHHLARTSYFQKRSVAALGHSTG